MAVTGLYLVSGTVGTAGGSADLNRTLLVFFVTLFLLLIVTLISSLVFLQRSIIVPLENLRTALQRMTEGHLDIPVQIKNRDEVGQVGELVNDLSINMQEVLLYIWNYTQQHFNLLDRISGECSGSVSADLNLSGIKQDLAGMQLSTEELQAIVVAHDYFEVKLEKKKMVSDTQQEQPD
jgi:methyl-accepting chemotaxis protein